MAFLAFLIGLLFLFLVREISVPILPAVSVFLSVFLFAKHDRRYLPRAIFSWILAAIGFGVYLASAIKMTRLYPLYSVLSIVFEYITCFCFIPAGFSVFGCLGKMAEIREYVERNQDK